MRIVFLILILVIINFSGRCQSTEFFKTYDLGSTTNPVLNHLIEIDNKIFVNGKISSPNQKILIIKTSGNGLLIDSNIIGADTGVYYTNNFIQISNNKILILGDHANFITSTDRQYMLFVDTNLFKTSDSIYTNILTSFWGNVNINHSYYFTGYTKYNNNNDSLIAYNLLFWKTDSNFNKITSNSIGIENIHEVGNCINAGYDNNLLLGGLTLKFNNQQDWYLVNTDTNGQVQGEYYYGNLTNTDFDGIKSITKGVDSSYFLAGVFHYYYIPPGTYSYLSPTVVKIDRQFNTLWTKKFGKPILGTSLTKMVSTSEGNQVILVQRSPYGVYTTIYSQVTKFNNNGDILWSRDYLQGDTTQYIRYRAWDLIETSDKGFAFCGSAIDTANVGPNQEAWLVKTDSLGCDGLQSCNDTALVCQILQAPDTACKNDTSWLHVRFKGRSAPYYVYANTTLALDSVYYPYTLPLWIDTLIPYVPATIGMQDVIISVHDPWGWQQSDTVQVYVKNCGAGNIEESWYPKKVEIYPNPATTALRVRMRAGTENKEYSITIYDMQGKVVKQTTTKTNETVIDINNLGQGVYGIRVTGDNLNTTERFIKL